MCRRRGFLTECIFPCLSAQPPTPRESGEGKGKKNHGRDSPVMNSEIIANRTPVAGSCLVRYPTRTSWGLGGHTNGTEYPVSKPKMHEVRILRAHAHLNIRTYLGQNKISKAQSSRPSSYLFSHPPLAERLGRA
ncbi:hypothetical protein BDP67DRAFT_530913 [Colletotrichum lupini]|nr:hypothetical protein BDP67DRAFT_530913 [Colletotrichum lupini]